MASSREEFRERDVSSERYSEDYGCSWIGVFVSLLVIVGLFMILGLNANSYTVFPIGIEPNTVLELDFVEESVFLVPIVLAAGLITWFYIRRNRSVPETS